MYICANHTHQHLLQMSSWIVASHFSQSNFIYWAIIYVNHAWLKKCVLGMWISSCSRQIIEILYSIEICGYSIWLLLLFEGWKGKARDVEGRSDTYFSLLAWLYFWRYLNIQDVQPRITFMILCIETSWAWASKYVWIQLRPQQSRMQFISVTSKLLLLSLSLENFTT